MIGCCVFSNVVRALIGSDVCYIMCYEFYSLVYSIGSRGNFRWELGLYEQLGPLCEIHVFDFGDFEDASLTAKNIHFHQWGLGSSYSPDYRRRAIERGVPFLPFQEIQKRLGHENRTIDLFKIDCESCEW